MEETKQTDDLAELKMHYSSVWPGKHEDAIDDLLERRADRTGIVITENDLVMMDEQIDEQDREIDELENTRFDALENVADLETLILEIDDDRVHIMELNDEIKTLIQKYKHKPTTTCR